MCSETDCPLWYANTEICSIVLYRNEYLAVRNPDAGFYLCQACQNVKRRTTTFSIRWLSPQEDNQDLFSPDYYDKTG